MTANLKKLSALFALTLFVAAGLSPLARAEEEKQNNLPLEITADSALEWNQKDKTYIARGNAVATQGELSVTGDVLTAEYAGEKGSTSDLTKVTADGHVTLKSGTDTATGDKAVYDLLTETVTLTGVRPKVVKGTDTLEADRMVVYLKDRALDHAEAIGNVVIVTSGEQKATGDKAIYTKATDLAELIGHVKLVQGSNWLEGDHAEMNLTTKISKMTAQKDSPRVKGVFFPSSGSKK